MAKHDLKWYLTELENASKRYDENYPYISEVYLESEIKNTRKLLRELFMVEYGSNAMWLEILNCHYGPMSVEESIEWLEEFNNEDEEYRFENEILSLIGED